MSREPQQRVSVDFAHLLAIDRVVQAVAAAPADETPLAVLRMLLPICCSNTADAPFKRPAHSVLLYLIIYCL